MKDSRKKPQGSSEERTSKKASLGRFLPWVIILILLGVLIGKVGEKSKLSEKEARIEVLEKQVQELTDRPKGIAPVTGKEAKPPTTGPEAKEREEEQGVAGAQRRVEKVRYVIDGDTIELENGERVRYLGINTPEKGRPYSTEATNKNKDLVFGREVALETDVQARDQYGRTLAYVYVGDKMVNLELVRQGYANTYTLSPNVKYQDKFLEAEREAREAGRGLWAKSAVLKEGSLKIVNINADAPGNDNQNKNGEWVEIKNTGKEALNLKGYTLKDEANHFYTFPDFTLLPGKSVFIYSGSGADTDSSLYWNAQKYAIWNNSGDTAFLRDASGNLVDSYRY